FQRRTRRCVVMATRVKNVGNWRIMPDATLAASYQACKMCQNRVGRIRRSRRIRHSVHDA
ncbi:hypothetical protein, partial [Escherichia coli]|uniref:hypothetical protein n=1 Tax=Escherichia coli TaxID=562 RepID=UPI001BC846BD